MALETFFDKANRFGTGIRGPRVLYHYTSWEAAESILRSQRFRASAHDCTNDEAELASADATILEAVRAARENARGIVTRRPVAEFIVGPNQDAVEGRKKAVKLLADVGYLHPERKVVVSEGKLACVSETDLDCSTNGYQPLQPNYSLTGNTERT
jgi:hypothetical protein